LIARDGVIAVEQRRRRDAKVGLRPHGENVKVRDELMANRYSLEPTR